MKLEDFLEVPKIQPEVKNQQPVQIPDYLINDPEIVGYPDLEMQENIYNWVLTELNEYIVNKTPISIKDYGCGRGDIYPLIKKFDNLTYIGYDNNPNIVEVGKQKYPGIDIQCVNFITHEQQPVTDVTFIIGTLNSKDSFSSILKHEDKWEIFNLALMRARSSTTKKIVFILAHDMYGYDEFLDYPLNELFNQFNSVTRFKLDYSIYKDIYKLTVIL